MDDFSDLSEHPKLGSELESWVKDHEKVRLLRYVLILNIDFTMMMTLLTMHNKIFSEMIGEKV